MTDTLLIVLLVAVLACLVLLVILAVRKPRDDGNAGKLDALLAGNRQLDAVLREEQRAGRAEMGASIEQFRGHVQEQLGGMAQASGERIDGFGKRLDQLTERTDRGMQGLREGLGEDARKAREEGSATLRQFGGLLEQRLGALATENEKRLGEVREVLESKLKSIQDDNAAKLEQMRQTVDEKLHATLETRLGESFRLVSERLEAVQRGLGEMQTLAAGVGDLKRVLTNVKTRGTFGEVQLGSLLEQILVAEQYAANVATIPGSSERVEYAIRLPGTNEGTPVWLPIDAKFPVEDYQRLLDAQDAADAEAALLAGRALEVRVREEAKRIHGKYVGPPHTTDFAILFLPTEGLYAEVIRRPGLSDLLQRDYRVTVAGPTTLTALLNSLQMGFRTLAIEKRSSEVWQVLAAVKTEFGKFGTVLERTRKQLDTVRNSIDNAGVRTRAIEKRLRNVQSLSGDASGDALQLALDAAEPLDDDDAAPPGLDDHESE